MPHGFAGSEFCTAIKYGGRITTRANGEQKVVYKCPEFTPSPQKSLHLTIQRTILKVQVVLNCTEHTKLSRLNKICSWTRYYSLGVSSLQPQQIWWRRRLKSGWSSALNSAQQIRRRGWPHAALWCLACYYMYYGRVPPRGASQAESHWPTSWVVKHAGRKGEICQHLQRFWEGKPAGEQPYLHWSLWWY